MIKRCKPSLLIHCNSKEAKSGQGERTGALLMMSWCLCIQNLVFSLPVLSFFFPFSFSFCLPFNYFSFCLLSFVFSNKELCFCYLEKLDM